MSIKEQIKYAHKFAKDIKIGPIKVTYNPKYAEAAVAIGQKKQEKNLQDTLDYVLEFAIKNEEFDLLVLTEYSCTECESISLLDRREEVDVCPYCTGSLYLTPGKSLNATLYNPTNKKDFDNQPNKVGFTMDMDDLKKPKDMVNMELLETYSAFNKKSFYAIEEQDYVGLLRQEMLERMSKKK
ncbi:hypothetical protein [Bacillus pumilus]|nr:hypothetical protein [Bacillus pumilus]